MSHTYAVLGSTGNCGKALIENLLATQNNKVNAFCRSKAKLSRQLPHIVDNKSVTVFEGNINDVELLKSCITGCKAVFHVVTSNDNIPGCNVGLATAQGIIAAMEQLKATSKPGLKLPKIVLLSSSTIDDYLARDMPWWFRPVMLTAASNVYDDLRRTEAFLRSHESWVSTIFIKPGGLSVDVQRGHKLDMDHEESFISYLDLSAAMIEAANDPESRYDMKNVGVVNKNGAAKFPRGTPACIIMGLLRHFFPYLHAYLPATGPS